jgi:hypothetical protein
MGVGLGMWEDTVLPHRNMSRHWTLIKCKWKWTVYQVGCVYYIITSVLQTNSMLGQMQAVVSKRLVNPIPPAKHTQHTAVTGYMVTSENIISVVSVSDCCTDIHHVSGVWLATVTAKYCSMMHWWVLQFPKVSTNALHSPFHSSKSLIKTQVTSITQRNKSKGTTNACCGSYLTAVYSQNSTPLKLTCSRWE